MKKFKKENFLNRKVLAKLVLFPIVINLLIFFLFKKNLPFLQAAQEVPVYFLLMTLGYSFYCFAVYFLTQLGSKFLLIKDSVWKKTYWGLTSFPFVIICGLSFISYGFKSYNKGPALSMAADKTAFERCGMIKQSRSPASTKVLPLHFSNQSSQAIEVRWLGYDGSTVKYNSLLPGEKYEQSSNLGHLWEVADHTGKCLGVFIVSEILEQALIVDSSVQ